MRRNAKVAAKGGPLTLPSSPADGGEGRVREPLVASENFDHEEPEETEQLDQDEESTPVAEVETEGGQAPDDALGLYLRQMGAIPLLSREQELALARKLEDQRLPLPACRPGQLVHARPPGGDLRARPGRPSGS